VAKNIALHLREHGVPTFYAPENLIGAQQWQDEILAALRRCDWFAVLLTPAAVQSMWVQRETAYALKEPIYRKQIIPLQLQDCDLESLEWLSLYQYINFRGEFDQGLRDLLRVWGLGAKART
jgi:hypothetical protein